MVSFSKFRLHEQLFAFKVLHRKEIVQTANIPKLTKAILKRLYQVLQESTCLISCMIIEEIYFSGYILLIDQICLIKRLLIDQIIWLPLLREILVNMCFAIVC